jgi:hypothetical protein
VLFGELHVEQHPARKLMIVTGVRQHFQLAERRRIGKVADGGALAVPPASEEPCAFAAESIRGVLLAHQAPSRFHCHY